MKHIGTYAARTHFTALLNEVERGTTIVITRRGRPAAHLIPADRSSHSAEKAVEDMKAFGRKNRNRLRGIRIRDLIEDGRRY